MIRNLKLITIFFVVFICFFIARISFANEISKSSNIDSYSKELKEANFNATPQNTIINLNINSNQDCDYEVYVNSNGSFSLPFKTTAKLISVEYKQNHLTKNIDFTSPSYEAGEIDYKNQKITIGSKIIDFKKSPIKMVYLQKGILDNTQDEIFVPVKIINEILECEFIPDISNYSVSVKINKSLKASITNNEAQENDNPFKASDVPDDTYVQINKPEKKGRITLDSIKFDNRSQYYLTNSSDPTNPLNDALMENFAQLSFKGSFFDGDYEIKTNTTNSNNHSPIFGGINFKYKKQFGDNLLELGQLSGLKIGDLVAANDLMGVSWENFGETKSDIKSVSGYVRAGSKINVLINNKQFATILTKGGYYDLKDLPTYSEKVRHLKLEEITANGEIKTILEKDYPFSPALLPKNKIESAYIAGISGYNYGLLSSGEYFDTNTKKFVMGNKTSLGLSDKLTMQTAVMGDHIISMPGSNVSSSMLGFLSASPLSGTVVRDFSYTQGETGIMSFDYKPTDKLSTSVDFGVSSASNKNPPDRIYKVAPIGYGASVSTDYNLGKLNLLGKIYDYSPDYYVAGSTYGNDFNDRLGGGFGANLNLSRISLNASINSYLSNLDKRYDGGDILFNDYSISSNIPFGNNSKLTLRHSSKVGQNSAGKLVNKDYEAEFNRQINSNMNLETLFRLSQYSSVYNGSNSSSYNSDYKLLSANLNYILPDKMGRLEFTHDITSYSSDVGTKFNAIRIGYDFPVFHKITSSVSCGYHYIGDKTIDFSASLGYLFDSGQKLELIYSYNRDGGNFVDNIFIPTTSRHSINLNMSDAFSLVGGGIRSIGSDINDGGYIEVLTYLDVNQNGVWDKDEPVISDIPVYIPAFSKNPYTNKNGVFLSNGIPEGFYKVGLNYDELPSLLSLSPAQKDYYYAKVDKNHKTKLSFGLISSVGNIFGNVNVVDEFNRKVDIKDIIVSIYNEKGEEIKYTSVDKDGNYNISGISPGKYIVKVDQSFLDTYHLKPQSSEKKVIIPPVYKDYVDLKDVNLVYCQNNDI